MKTLIVCSSFLALASAAAPDDEPDLTKVIVERPIKKSLAATELVKLAPGKVHPGRVAWHASYDDALAAAKVSGKPVLLFQLLGRLDDEFC